MEEGHGRGIKVSHEVTEKFPPVVPGKPGSEAVRRSPFPFGRGAVRDIKDGGRGREER